MESKRIVIIGRVRHSRQLTAPTFPLPVAGKSIRYADDEGSEMDDALLRMEAPEHLRNNGRNHDPRHEWGQCGYMIISAMQSGVNEPFFRKPDVLPIVAYAETKISLMFALISEAHGDHQDTLLNLHSALNSWLDFCHLNDWDPEQLIDETCLAFEAKHCQAVA